MGSIYHRHPGTLVKRLLAIVYDCLLLFAILFIASAVAIALNDGEAIVPSHPAYPLYVALLPVIAFVFFGWFWTHGGQTLGLKTWKLQLRSGMGGPVDWKQSLLRFAAALLSWAVFGAGFIWSLVDPERRTWHDIVSGTVLLDVSADQADASTHE